MIQHNKSMKKYTRRNAFRTKKWCWVFLQHCLA